MRRFVTGLIRDLGANSSGEWIKVECWRLDAISTKSPVSGTKRSSVCARWWSEKKLLERIDSLMGTDAPNKVTLATLGEFYTVTTLSR